MVRRWYLSVAFSFVYFSNCVLDTWRWRRRRREKLYFKFISKFFSHNHGHCFHHFTQENFVFILSFLSEGWISKQRYTHRGEGSQRKADIRNTSCLLKKGRKEQTNANGIAQQRKAERSIAPYFMCTRHIDVKEKWGRSVRTRSNTHCRLISQQFEHIFWIWTQCEFPEETKLCIVQCIYVRLHLA